MTDSASHPVLVHCASGNRVGPVLIAWLVLDRGWTFERAVKAAKQGGLRSEELEIAAREYIGRRR
jgi:protein-tyrosine phosphatase